MPVFSQGLMAVPRTTEVPSAVVRSPLGVAGWQREGDHRPPQGEAGGAGSLGPLGSGLPWETQGVGVERDTWSGAPEEPVKFQVKLPAIQLPAASQGLACSCESDSPGTVPHGGNMVEAGVREGSGFVRQELERYSLGKVGDQA